MTDKIFGNNQNNKDNLNNMDIQNSLNNDSNLNNQDIQNSLNNDSNLNNQDIQNSLNNDSNLNNQDSQNSQNNQNNNSNLNNQGDQANQAGSNDQGMEDKLLLKKMLLFMRKTRTRMGGRGVPGMGPHRGMPGMPPVNGMPGPGRDIPCARPGKGMHKMGPCHEMPGVGPGPGMPPVGTAPGMPPLGVASGMPPVGAAPGMPPMPSCRHHGKHPALSREHLLVIIGKYPEGIRQKTIAEKAGINQSSTSELIDKLESAGYIERKVDPSDKRATLLFLTEKGSARAAEVEDERNEMFNGMFAKLTAQEKQTLSDILDKLLADETV